MAFKTLSYIEKQLPEDYELRYSPTFIVGAPRTGSTLTMQLVTWAIPTSYFNNLTTSSYQILGYPLPHTTARLGKLLRLANNYPIFESSEGNIKGRARSTEGTDIWEFWFGSRRSPVEPEELSSSQIRLIYQAVAVTEHTFDLPFVNKTINLALRIRALAKVFPSAIFIQIVRDPVDVAQSIYKIRLGKPDRGYFGARPRECEGQDDRNLIEQVCEQVYYIEKNIAFERSVVGENRFLTVAYEDVCKNPLKELYRIAEFMNNNGAPAKVVRSVPPFFKAHQGSKIAKDEYITMCELLEKLYSQDRVVAETGRSSIST